MEEIEQLQPVETEGILQLPNSWIEKGFHKGLQEGRKKGREEGRKEGMEKRNKWLQTRRVFACSRK